MSDIFTKMPACLTNIQAVAPKDMWFDVTLGRSNVYFGLPRPLVWAGKYHCEEFGLWVVLEVQWLTSECFLKEDDTVRRVREKYSRLCLFTSDQKDGPYVFRCADFIWPIFGSRLIEKEDLEFLKRLAVNWIAREFKPSYWKSPAMTRVLSLLR